MTSEEIFNLAIPAISPESESLSGYIVVPLTPNSEHPNTDIHIVNTIETTELRHTPITPESSTTVILKQLDDVDSEEMLLHPFAKRHFHDSSEECESPIKKAKKIHPVDLKISLSANSKRTFSTSSPQLPTPGSSFGDQIYEKTPTSPPRPRGRPKSNKNGYIGLARTPTDDNNTNKRGRGRPPKYMSQNSFGESGKLKRGRPPLSVKSRSRTTSSSISQQFEYGSIIWGKIKSCEWWPGMVIAPSVIGKTETPQGCQWVTWFGEYQYSDVLHKNIKPITSFLQLLSLPSFSNPTYKNAIFKCIDVSKKRTELYKRTKFSSDTDSKEEDDSTPVIFEDILNDRNSKEKQREIQSLYSLTQEEQAKLAWALKGFPPYNLAGLLTRCEDEMSPIAPCYQMIDSGSEIESNEELGALDSAKINIGKHFSFRNSEEHILHDSRAEKERKNNTENLDLLRGGKIEIQNFCLGCHKHDQSLREHPLIEGGFCERCFREFQACFYLFDENGEQEYCSICAGGEHVVICNNSSCASFCQSCIQDLISQEEKENIINKSEWHCFLCQQADKEGPLSLNNLRVRPDWNERLLQVFRNASTDHPFKYRAADIPPPRPAKYRTPLRVLALFDGISTSLLALKELGFEIEYYIASEIDLGAQRISQCNFSKITHVGDIKKITLEDIDKWGPFDLVCAGPPSQDLSTENPNRKGLYDQRGTGPLVFEFYRILNYCFPNNDDNRSFFWFFENTVSMKNEDRDTISRFLAQEPVTIRVNRFSALDDQRYFWSNIPGLNRPKVPGHNTKIHLQECLMNGLDRYAKCDKIKPPSYRSSRSRETVYPVKIRMVDSDMEDDNLFVSEFEQIHGLPRHYTDVCNTSIEDRQSLIENAWCVPVIKYVLAPLKGYFKSTPPAVV